MIELLVKLFSNHLPRGRRGFTLAEGVVAVIVIGLMATMAIPRYRSHMERIRTAEATQILYALYQAQMEYRIDTGSFTGNADDLNVDIPTPKHYQAPQISAGAAVSCNGSGTAVASIDDDESSYTLYILDTGDIRCIPCDGSICDDLGFVEL